MIDVKVTITDKDGIVLSQAGYKEFIKEVVSSDNSTGFSTKEDDITIQDFAQVVKEEIISEHGRLVKIG